MGSDSPKHKCAAVILTSRSIQSPPHFKTTTEELEGSQHVKTIFKEKKTLTTAIQSLSAMYMCQIIALHLMSKHKY